MATAESVKTKIRGMIDSANTATGNTDTDLTTAVSSLIAGYGSGGGGGLPSGFSAIETGEYTPDSDQTCPVSIPHGLGVAPNFVSLILADDVGSASEVAGSYVIYTACKSTIGSSFGAYCSRQVLDSGGLSTTGGTLVSQNNIATKTHIVIGGTRKLLAGRTYVWVAAVIDAL